MPGVLLLLPGRREGVVVPESGELGRERDMLRKSGGRREGGRVVIVARCLVGRREMSAAVRPFRTREREFIFIEGWRLVGLVGWASRPH